MIVHRVIDSEDEYPLRTSSYHNVQSRYSPVFTDAYIQPPRRFQNGFLNERSQSYSVSMEKHRDIAYKQGNSVPNILIFSLKLIFIMRAIATD